MSRGLQELLVYVADLTLGPDAQCSLRRIVGNIPFCNRPAAYACKLGCCGNIKVVCKAHRNISEAVYPKLFVCSRCREHDPDIVACWPV